MDCGKAAARLCAEIVINLLSKAIRFTAMGEVKVTVSTDDAFMGIAVSDTGVGIPTEALDTIFEEFQQVRLRQGGAD